MASECIKINWWNHMGNDCSPGSNLDEWEIIHYLNSPPQTPTSFDSPRSPIHVELPQSPTPVDSPQSPTPLESPRSPIHVKLPQSPIHVELPQLPTTLSTPPKSDPPINTVSVTNFLYRMMVCAFTNFNRIHSTLTRYFNSFLTN